MLSHEGFSRADRHLAPAAQGDEPRGRQLPSIDGGVADAGPSCARTPDRDAFQRYVCHTWKRMSCQTPVIRAGSEAQRRGRGTRSRRQVTCVPFDPPLKCPMRVALTNA
jgi:hypothetical protein